ncbi:Uncharacterized protein family [Macleaya cordata]|uniref:Uncharacterized protein family n=1 Tax=Macleaya cordata TaxID=56857 RepID=A0A200PV42_MACCD|nr:Uncharacterized protein family [Macleaya cordata]
MQTMAHLMFGLSSLLVQALLALQGIHAVDFKVIEDDGKTPGNIRFENEISLDYSLQTLESATTFIWRIFGQTNKADRKNVHSISLFVSPIDKDIIAYTIRGHHIHVNVNYLADYSGDVKREFTGILYYEITHVWQWNGNENAPVSLIRGIAAYVRLKANYAPSNWQQAGAGNRWDERSDVTAHFLDYCNSLRSGFVAELNSKMRTGYSDNFFVELLGKTVDQLWADYKAKYLAD